MVIRVICDLVPCKLERRDGLAVLVAFEVFPDREEGGSNRFVIQPFGQARNAAVIGRVRARPVWNGEPVDRRVERHLVQINRYRC